MRIKNRYILWLLSSALILTACDKIEPDFFDESANGAYFDYNNSAEFEHTINFGEYVIGEPDTVPITLKVKLLGYLKEENRTLSIKKKNIEGFEPADITIPEVVFGSNEYEKEVEIKVKRPEIKGDTFAICIYLDGEGDLGHGIKGKEEFFLYVKETYETPSEWKFLSNQYLGQWDKEKHFYLAYLMGNDRYYNALYDSRSQSENYDSIIKYNEMVFNDLFKEVPAEPVTLDFPILDETLEPKYDEPYFWKEYAEKHLGEFNMKIFSKANKAMKVTSTNNICELYALAENAETMKDVELEYHKDEFLNMLNEYYKYPKAGYPIAEYKEHCWVQARAGVKYNLRIPYWWDSPDSLGRESAAGKIGDFYGKYSDEKYQFMITTMMNTEGPEKFITESMFPLSINQEDGSLGWDGSVGGEERLNECYRIIKDAYDEFAEYLNFTIPERDFNQSQK